MRFDILAVICIGLTAFAKNGPTPILKSHNEVKLLDQSQSRSEELEVFSDGRVSYQEAPNYGKKLSFETRLTQQKLQRLTALINRKDMRALPAKIGPQIKVLDGQVDKRLEIRRAGTEQIVEIENFYPQLNGHRPAYPKVLVELECMLQDIQRRAAKRAAPSPEQDWCPDALGQR
jgi:hypothetical protein